MGVVELVFIAIGLAMDAFAVSVCKGLGMRRLDMFQAVIIGLFFGGFQAFMPLVGWVLGAQFAHFVSNYAHWIAFVLLAFVGGKMLLDALRSDDSEEDHTDNSLNIGELFVLAIATSIDALAVGISFAFLEVSILPAIALIGIITFVLSVIGVGIGHYFGARWEKPATIFGGVVLIFIGLRILIEHLFI